MSKDECSNADWAGIGRYDGSQGHKLNEFAQMKEQCEVYSRQPDEVAYMRGYNEGLVRYCVPKNAEILGRQGAQYFEGCPEEMRSDFLKAYRYGLSQFRVQMNRDRYEAFQLQKEDEKRSSIQ